MEPLALPLKFILAFIIGAVIGIERELNEKKGSDNQNKPTAVLGLRTFSLASILGVLVGVLYPNFLILSIVVAFAFFILSIIFYVIDSLHTKDTGITTELGLFFSFLIGLLISTEVIPIQLILALSVGLIILLSKKESIKNILEDIRKKELNAFLSYAVLALIILPFLPNVSYTLSDIPALPSVLSNLGFDIEKIKGLELINPFKVWIIVVLITGIELIGYVLERTIGQKRGWMLASAAGGFISSTATTQTMAQQSNKSQNINHLLSAVIIANLVSFIQIGIIIGSLNTQLLAYLAPTIGLMVLGAVFISIFFLKSNNPARDEQATKDYDDKQIINLTSALKFAGLYIAVSLISKLALAIYGNSGFLITTALGAIVGLDAVMINTAQVAGNTIDFKLAATAFILANLVNLTGKSLYSFLHGKKEFALKFTASMALIMLLGLIGFLINK